MRKQLGTIVLVAGVGLTTACGSAALAGGPDGADRLAAGAAAATQQLTVTALDSMRFEPGTITVRAGQPVELTLQNRGSMAHDLSLFEGVSQPVKIEAEGGQSASATFTIERPGTYTFVCTVLGHAAAGMRGTIRAQ